MSSPSIASPASSSRISQEIWGEDGLDDKTRKEREANEDADDDLPSAPKRPRTAGSSQSRRPKLFLSDDEEESSDGGIQEVLPSPKSKGKGKARASPPPLDPELDALFPADEDEDDWMSATKPKKAGAAEEDDDYGLGPSKTMDQLIKEATEKHTRQLAAEAPSRRAKPSAAPSAKKGVYEEVDVDGSLIAGEADGKEKEKDAPKKRKPMPRLDENRLVGENGFLALINQTKGFKSKGKGHETADLAKALEIYQLWAHKLYPKTQFRDTAEKVEKLCRSRMMVTQLSVWRDEVKNGPRKKSESPIPLGDGPEEMSVDGDDDDNATTSRRKGDSVRPSLSSKPGGSGSTVRNAEAATGDDADFDDDEIAELMAESAGRSQPAKSASSSSHAEVDDDDFWADVDEAISSTAKPQPAPANPVSKPKPLFDEDDEAAMWGDMDGDDDVLAAFMDETEGIEVEAPPKVPVTSSTPIQDVEMDGTTQPIPPSTSATTSPTARASTTDQDHEMASSSSKALEEQDVTEEDLRKREAIRKEFDEGWEDMYV